jgi:hypothetical protein
MAECGAVAPRGTNPGFRCAPSGLRAVLDRATPTLAARLGVASPLIGFQGCRKLETGSTWRRERINAGSVEDMARWARLRLAHGSFAGRRIVSPENLAYLRRPKVAVDDHPDYGMAWMLTRTRNGEIVWHDGATYSFGAFLGLLPERDVGLIVLSNAANVGLPTALGIWALDRLLDNPAVDYVADTLKKVKAKVASEDKMFARPASPRPFPALAPLAGSVVSPAFGKAVLRCEGDALVLELKETGAELALTPWDGDRDTVAAAPNGP